MPKITSIESGDLLMLAETFRGASFLKANLPEAEFSDLDLSGADFQEANLTCSCFSGADLRDADLRDADLRNAHLEGADLRGADLQDANLRGADLRGAYLSNANLEGADLRGAYIKDVNFRDAALRDVKWPKDLVPLSIEQEEQNLRIVSSAALFSSDSLDMISVHTCETTHCMAGWACHSLPEGLGLEEKYGWWLAGFHLLGAEASKMFYSFSPEVTNFLRQYAEPNPA